MTNVNNWAKNILEANMEGFNMEERINYLNDVSTHGCESGCVSGVIYYRETEQLFKDNMIEILNTAEDHREETGHNIVNTIADNHGLGTLYNSLVWFVVEEVAYHMLADIENHN